ncbi:MAG: ATP-grasp domain-containing protein [Bacillota bacterium]|jgi:carbamoyl-phosphate synthase large subunit|nr:ATP-grasp domain-containing protein [Bacillota bacterium]HPZ21868.1 ATP-grasp domain-containing protein [Bacillota bacterium]
MNILILSCGTRNKIIQYFKRELGSNGLVMATDCSELAPALYDADKYFIVPGINEASYLDTILNICKENDIRAVLSLIDPELSMLAANKDLFLKAGITPIISDYDVVEMCFDKWRFNQFLLENGFKAIRSYVDKELFFRDVECGIIDYPVIVKPVRGSASLGIRTASGREEIDLLFSKHHDLMIQEYIDCPEYGADVYVDMLSSEPVAIFTKEKIKMRAGETDKSVSVKDEKLFALLRTFVKTAGLRGIVDIDLFKINAEYYISEVNPRFGGGYPHAYECGVNVPGMIIKNLKGNENQDIIGQYAADVYMMKYNDVKILR